ncbi:MAG: C40 family peptidase [Candidatus Eisenbacteria bacterium]|uniref:C40 family peptidase n=1 Tax=Eiseniibacteriota bacterium TaxID=2212470 RepID=A0A849SG68_UNCEI|nr:C40 family peptidase [Candidatus Eisenbacteria bacterium]
MTRITHGIVANSALDLRARADHRSELTSQLLFGEVVRRLGADRGGEWWRVESVSDGYRGWVRAWGLVGCDAARAADWRRRATARVNRLETWIRVTAPEMGPARVRAWWNSRLAPLGGRGVQPTFELPDGRVGTAPRSAFGPARSRVPRFGPRVESLRGVPYLWGGRTPAGLDCSGLTQLLWLDWGVSLPRDARQQLAACRPVGGVSQARPGDLLFFRRGSSPVSHVGLWLGRGCFTHARGTVTLGSLERSNSFYDKKLADQFFAVGRCLGEA